MRRHLQLTLQTRPGSADPVVERERGQNMQTYGGMGRPDSSVGAVSAREVMNEPRRSDRQRRRWQMTGWRKLSTHAHTLESHCRNRRLSFLFTTSGMLFSTCRYETGPSTLTIGYGTGVERATVWADSTLKSQTFFESHFSSVSCLLR